ncbi:MAG: hypothetical protein QM778_00250 [Myxococcales bacterium]
MNIILQIATKLSAKQFEHEHPHNVDKAINAIVDANADLLKAYLRRFRGPIGSSRTSFQLLDAIEEQPNIVTQTTFLRSEFQLGQQWVAISDIVGGSLLVLNTEKDKVFNVDFEGGIELLRDGTLPPISNSFEEFLIWFFVI